jgi:uncharacterized protein DUF6788
MYELESRMSVRSSERFFGGGDPVTQSLAIYEDKLKALAAQLAAIGFVSQGSVVARSTTCGKPGCRCQEDPPQPHGPYWQYSRALGGKTVTRWISEEQAILYKEWIANRRRLAQIVAEMEEVSRAAAEVLIPSVAGEGRSHRSARRKPQQDQGAT